MPFSFSCLGQISFHKINFIFQYELHFSQMNSSDNTPENPQISHHRQGQSDNDPDQTQKRAQKFSIESLRNNLQEISQETRETTQGISFFTFPLK